VFDDGSTDERMQSYLNDRRAANDIAYVDHQPPEDRAGTDVANLRLGAQRRAVVDYFMDSKYTHLLMLDDDMLLPGQTGVMVWLRS